MSATTRSTAAPAGAELARRLFEARTVAVVGASSRPGAVGRVAMTQLVEGGFPGACYPVNPRHNELEGRRCFPSLADLPESVDLAVLAVPDAVVEEQLELAAAEGVGAVVVFGGYSDGGGTADGPSMSDRLAAIARRHGLALCGPNGMGFLDLARRLRAVGYYEPFTRTPGRITLISQSGSVFSAVLHNTRGVEFDLAVSTGQEAVLTAADYLDHALQRDTTEVVALFLETVRDGPAFASALRRALERDVPVVALKVGRTPAAGELIRAHSGGLAGDDAAYEALFDTYGVARVRSLDELMDTVELFAAGRRAAVGALATVHDSGGERAHVADLAAEMGVPFARIGATTVRRLDARLDPGLVAANPLDAWGSGRDFQAAYRDHLLALHDDPDTAVVAFAVDLTTEDGDDTGFARVTREVQAATVKPFVVVANLTSGIDHDAAERVRAHGVPVLEGTSTGLAAIRHLLARRDVMARPAPVTPPRPDATVTTRWRSRLAQGRDLTEADGLALLRDYGLAVVPHRAAGDADTAVAAAEELGWPVAVKTAVAGIDHKSDVGGVHLDLRGADEVRNAYGDLAARLGPDVLVSRMVPAAVELSLGLVHDPQFGPVLVVGAGGRLVELLADRGVALPPVDAAAARRLLDRLAVRSLLDGVRGGAAADLDAVVAAVVSLSVLAADLGDLVAALDVNPLLAGADGCVAVDALVVPRRAGAARGTPAGTTA